MAGCKNPQILKDDSQYTKRVKEVKLRQAVTPLKDNEQAPALALSLSERERAEDAALELDITVLNSSFTNPFGTHTFYQWGVEPTPQLSQKPLPP